MIEIIAGKYGPKLLGPGSVLELSKEEEARLVKRKVAIYKQTQDNLVKDNPLPDVKQEEDFIYLSDDKIRKMKSKQELVDYAELIELKGLNIDMRKEDLVNAILNFIQENSEEVSE